MIRVRTVFTGVAGTPWYVNMYAAATDATDAGLAHARVVDFWEGCKPGIVNEVAINVEGDMPQIDPLTGDTLGIFSVPSVSQSGESTSDPLPFANQCNVRLITAGIVNNRRVIGRILIPGTNELQTAEGLFTLAAAGYYDSVATALTVGSGGGRVGVWSRPVEASEGSGVAPRIGSFHEVTSVATQRAPSILRSRRD